MLIFPSVYHTEQQISATQDQTYFSVFTGDTDPCTSNDVIFSS